MKSPGDLDEHDYSLSVSDLNKSLYNNSQGRGDTNTLGQGYFTSGTESNPP